MVEPHRIDTGTHPPVKQQSYRMLDVREMVIKESNMQSLE
jgi:hypothetical protein